MQLSDNESHPSSCSTCSYESDLSDTEQSEPSPRAALEVPTATAEEPLEEILEEMLEESED